MCRTTSIFHNSLETSFRDTCQICSMFLCRKQNDVFCYFFVLSALPQFYQLFAREMFLLDVLPKRRELLQRLSTTSTWSCKLAAPASENRSRNHEKPELTNQVLSSVHVFSLLLRCAFEFFEDQTNKRLILWMTTLLPQLKGVLCY